MTAEEFVKASVGLSTRHVIGIGPRLCTDDVVIAAGNGHAPGTVRQVVRDCEIWVTGAAYCDHPAWMRGKALHDDSARVVSAVGKTDKTKVVVSNRKTRDAAETIAAYVEAIDPG